MTDYKAIAQAAVDNPEFVSHEDGIMCQKITPEADTFHDTFTPSVVLALIEERDNLLRIINLPEVRGVLNGQERYWGILDKALEANDGNPK